MSKRGHEKDFFLEPRTSCLRHDVSSISTQKKLCNLEKVKQFASRKTLIKEKLLLFKKDSGREKIAVDDTSDKDSYSTQKISSCSNANHS